MKRHLDIDKKYNKSLDYDKLTRDELRVEGYYIIIFSTKETTLHAISQSFFKYISLFKNTINTFHTTPLVNELLLK